MRGADKLVLVLGLVVPLLIAGLGWPLFVRWLGGGGTPRAPETAGLEATGTSAAAPPQPTAIPVAATPEPATPAPGPPRSAAARPEATRVSQGAEADTGPTAAVATFYELVQRHEFDTAAELWTPRMRAAFPPAENIDRRFADTEQLTVNRVEVVSARGDQAVVEVDLNERDPAGQRHYVGTWSVVHTGSAWLLDEPNLEAAP
jgi:hypothetical protein